MMVKLQVCKSCGAVQYPRREVCANCLSTELSLQELDGAATVLSWTRGHVSVSPAFQDKLPLAIGRLQLDVGPVVIAFIDKVLCETGTRAVLEGEQTFFARA